MIVPRALGTRSENAAHRIAVEWEDGGERRAGVFVPRRDSDSRLNTILGGRLFAGDYHPATFETDEADGRYEVRMRSDDGEASVSVAAETTDELPLDSVFETVRAASKFFRRGSLGYSPSGDGEFEGIELCTVDWDVTPLAVESASSSFFEGERFPDGTVELDDALLMEDITHEWRQRESVCA